ncbi:putative cytochrome P450 [Medicago truncatula]|uniref:Cytochrome P450 family 71 protein n=1 Tax=Medicago truncatula TaxID=3880 RepID=G7IA31_MEDTR|nr:cytochrome P450 71D11 [Medicago truncatula]XP_024634098.1 cytochrome P450 71D11 [Medicago truncatula]XP_024634113.1 cytochrome P450 71D11 [Medicago truncatula]AES59942.1 cytochrome P450 family 71 protein [Medicago truncatula]RHN78189.1 putative cytochrome P450 [Medicago truncatula]
MDSPIFYLLALVLFFIFMLVVLTKGRNLKKKSSAPNLPPGPWKLPIIGHIHHLVSSTPHQKLRDLAKVYGPLMHLQLGEISAIVVSSPEYAREVMKTHDIIFASKPKIVAIDILLYGSTDIAFSPYGNYWRQLRKICTIELLTQKRVSSFRPIREEEFTNLIKSIDSQQGSPINITQAVVTSIMTITTRAAFGNKCKGQEQLVSLANGESVGGGFDIGELFPSAKWLQLVSGFRSKIEVLHRQIDLILVNIINEHKEAKSKAKEGEVEEDLVDVLQKFQGGNDIDQDICLTDNNIKAIILDIIGAGGETSSTTIVWAMAELVRDPRVMKKAQYEVRKIFNKKGTVGENYINELEYLKLVVKETLRLHPPTPLLLRECGQACEIEGYHIPAKSKVIVNAWTIGRDPKYWTEPERFHPERFIGSSIDYKGNNFEYIPFGAGRRICPGITFGLINVELALALLLYHFDWRLPNGMKGEDLDMTEQFGANVKRKSDLYLIPTIPLPSRI